MYSVRRSPGRGDKYGPAMVDRMRQSLVFGRLLQSFHGLLRIFIDLEVKVYLGWDPFYECSNKIISVTKLNFFETSRVFKLKLP